MAGLLINNNDQRIGFLIILWNECLSLVRKLMPLLGKASHKTFLLQYVFEALLYHGLFVSILHNF